MTYVTAVLLLSLVSLGGTTLLATSAAANPIVQPGPNGPNPSVKHIDGEDQTAWICDTTAYQPYQSGPGGRGSVIHAGMDLNCNVTVSSIYFYICVQLSKNNSTWSNQGGTCGWRLGDPDVGVVSYAEADWTCIGANGWYYRTQGYTQKTFPDGTVSDSPVHTSSPYYAIC